MGNGGTISKPATEESPSPKKNMVTVPFDELIRFVMPVYYTKAPLPPHGKDKVICTWKMVMTNQGKGYHRLKQDDPIATPCATSMECFSRRLILRFMEVHPVTQTMLKKDPLKQGQLFMNMISLLIKEMDNTEVFTKHLTMLAKTHIKFGVRATEFGIFGEVLFWTLRLVLGKEDYDVATHAAWIKFYSRILEVVVPIVLQFEMEQKEATQRLVSHRLMPITDFSEVPTLRDGKEEELLTVENTVPRY